MKKLLFTLRDAKAEAFLDPIFARTRAEAIRSLEGAVNGADSDFQKYPHDFDLFEVGTFDQVTGKLEGHIAPVHVISAFELVRPTSGKLEAM